MLKYFSFTARNRATCLSLITILQLQVLHVLCSPPQISVCQTKACKSLATILGNNMNENLDPCNNFYDYVCYGWTSHNPKPKNVNFWNLDKSMEYNVAKQLRILLEDKTQTNVPLVERAKKLYNTCLKFPYMGKLDPELVKNTVKKVGEVPMLSERRSSLSDTSRTVVDNNYIKLTGDSMLFDYNVAIERKNGRIILAMREPTSAYGMITRYEPWRGNEKEYYKAFLNKVLKSTFPGPYAKLGKSLAQDLEDVLKFRDAFTEVIILSSARESLELVTIARLQQMYDRIAKSKKKVQINWLDKLKPLHRGFEFKVGVPYSDKTMIEVQRDYFPLLANLLDKTPKHVILNHIHLYFMERHIKLTREMLNDLEKSVSEIDNDESTGEVRHDSDRWQWCIDNHFMKHTLQKMYGSAYLPKNSKDEVEALFEDAKQLLKLQISESNWLDETTKRDSLNKVDRITSQLGYPEWYTEPSGVQKQPTDIDPLHPTAYYVQETNKVHVSAAYLQPPIYSPKLPFVISYGATVSMLGHELYHGFGHKGLKHDANGTNRIWWSKAMYSKFLQQAECLDKKYTKYRLYELKKYGNVSDDLPATVDEDLADVMGLKLAYMGYERKLQENKNSCPVLPGFEGLGCNKLFFVAFANAFCTGFTPSEEKSTMESDKHSLPRIRVNAAVSNMAKFTTAFGCTPKDQLYVAKPCNIWKA